MAWTTPVVIETPCGAEINAYISAEILSSNSAGRGAGVGGWRRIPAMELQRRRMPPRPRR